MSFPSEEKRKFWIANCMHIFCESCFTDKDFCKLCNKPCHSMAINKQMPAEVRDCLEPRSIPKIVGNLEKVWNLQSRQNKIFCTENDNKKRYDLAKERFFKYQEVAKVQNKTIQQENAIIAKLKAAYA